MCSPKFFLMFVRVKYDYDRIVINEVFISGYNELCYHGHKSMDIQLFRSYGMNITLCNSQFYNTTQLTLRVRIEDANALILVKNCTFKYIIHKMELLHRIVHNEIPINNVTIRFENCVFYCSVASYILVLQFVFNKDDLCVSPSNVTIENCTFTNNSGTLMVLLNAASNCKTNVFLNQVVNFAKNIAGMVMQFYRVAVHFNGTITVLENVVTHDILKFQDCVITFVKIITFLSNLCDTIIYM